MEKKKILIVSCIYDPEPLVSAKISGDLASDLNLKGHEVTVIAPRPSRPKGFDFKKAENTDSESNFKNNISVIRLLSFVYPNSNPIGRLLESISFGLHSYKFIRKNNFDKVYMNTWPIFGQFAVAIACKKKKIPYDVHVQDIYPESLTNKLPTILRKVVALLLMPFENYTLKYARKTIVISQNMKSYLVKTRKHIKDNIEVVYNWQDESQFNESNNNDASSLRSKFTFTYLGNIGPVAGVDVLIRAFQRANLRDCCLIIAGGGSQRKFCNELALTTPQLDIKFIDVPKNSVAKIQSDANILLLPVIKGGALSSIPSKLPAYMLSSRPILATVDKQSDVAIAIEEAGCGWVGDAEDVSWLAEHMKKASYTDTKVLDLLGKNGRRYCLDTFGRDKNLKRLVDCVVE